MNTRIVVSFVFLVATFLLLNNNQGYSQDTSKTKKTNIQIEPNGNYKHNIPVSKNHTFKDNFTKAPKDTIHRNYKQQNSRKRSVRFRDHFKTPSQHDHNSYKDPQGI